MALDLHTCLLHVSFRLSSWLQLQTDPVPADVSTWWMNLCIWLSHKNEINRKKKEDARFYCINLEVTLLKCPEHFNCPCPRLAALGIGVEFIDIFIVSVQLNLNATSREMHDTYPMAFENKNPLFLVFVHLIIHCMWTEDLMSFIFHCIWELTMNYHEERDM